MNGDHEEFYQAADHDDPDLRDQALSDLLVPSLFRDALQKTGINQSELARRTGLTRDAISRYATGRTPVPDNKLLLIAQALGTKPSRIVPKRKALDGIPPRAPDDPDFSIRPSYRTGMVRLEISADVDLDVAVRIVALLTRNGSYPPNTE